MSVIPLKADIRQREWHVRYVPEADMRFLAFKLSQSNPIRSEVMRPLGVLIEIN
jgi:hypothetical protein